MNAADPVSSAFFYDRFLRFFPDVPSKGKRNTAVNSNRSCEWMNLLGRPLEIYDTNSRMPTVRLKAISNMTANVVPTSSGGMRRIGGGRPDVIFLTRDKAEVNFPLPIEPVERATEWFDMVSLLDYIDRNPPKTEYMVLYFYRSFEYVLRSLRLSYGRRPYVCANMSLDVVGAVDLNRVRAMREIGMPLQRLESYIALLKIAQRGENARVAKRVLKIEEQSPRLRNFAESDFLQMLPSEVRAADVLIRRDIAKKKQEEKENA